MSIKSERIDRVIHSYTELYRDRMWAYVAFLDDAEWSDVESEHPEAKYGWTYPFEVDDELSDSGIGILFHPERIVALADDLDDEMFGEYIDAIEYIINAHISRLDTMTLDERIKAAEELMYSNGAGSLILLSDIQIKALDR